MGIIQTRMLGNIKTEWDKSEGGFFSDITKANEFEFEEQNKMMQEILDKSFIDTSYGKYLERKVLEQGLVRKPATKANGYVTITGQEGAAIELGDKVASDTLIYTVLESKIIAITKNITVKIECDELGKKGNCSIEAIKNFPVTIPGLVSVINKDVFSNGYDEETDEELRVRYLEKVRTPPTSGNKYHYLSWAKEVIGVGGAKVFPLWNGNGTVKVIIIDSNERAADATLVNAVATHTETVRPIGATVTVISATEKLINITVKLTIDSKNYTIEQVKTNIQNNIAKYLASIAFADIYVSFGKIGSFIIASDGVVDYRDLIVNGAMANILVNPEEVAIIGTIINI